MAEASEPKVGARLGAAFTVTLPLLTVARNGRPRVDDNGFAAARRQSAEWPRSRRSPGNTGSMMPESGHTPESAARLLAAT